MEAIGGLPEPDQRLVLGYLVGRVMEPAAPGSGGGAEPSVASSAAAATRLTPRPQGEDWAARAVRLLLGGGTVEGVAEAMGIQDDSVRAVFRDVASRPEVSERTASVLEAMADGRTSAEAAKELSLSEEEVIAALESLLPSPPARRLGRALQACALLGAFPPPSIFHADPPLPSGPTAKVHVSRGGADQQMVPVRFPEPLYRRLKEWCAGNGFSMAVVVRGLVERFLEDQDQRAA